MIAKQIRHSHPTAQWYTSEMTELNGHAAFLLDFRSTAVDTKIRNMMIGTILEERLLLISFNTTRELETTWVPIGAAIVQSIKIDG